MDIQNIPWHAIEAKLTGMGHNQAWLARTLNVGTNVIANWRTRGGAPLARAGELARALGCTTDELLLLTEAAPKSRPQSEDLRGNSSDLEKHLIGIFRSLGHDGRQELVDFAEFLRVRHGSKR